VSRVVLLCLLKGIVNVVSVVRHLSGEKMHTYKEERRKEDKDKEEKEQKESTRTLRVLPKSASYNARPVRPSTTQNAATPATMCASLCA